MMDSSSLLAITGNVPTTQFNRMPFQETGRYFPGDFPSVIRPLVKKSFQPTRVEMLPLAMKRAFGLLRTGRPGAVNIDVPLNVFQETADAEVPDPDPRVQQRAADLEGVLETALKANRPYLVEVPVDREIRPVGTGTWSLPPIPHGEPNFRKLAGLDK